MKKTKDIKTLKIFRSLGWQDTPIEMYKVWIGEDTQCSCTKWVEILSLEKYITHIRADAANNCLPLIIRLDPRFEGDLEQTLQELYDANRTDSE